MTPACSIRLQHTCDHVTLERFVAGEWPQHGDDECVSRTRRPSNDVARSRPVARGGHRRMASPASKGGNDDPQMRAALAASHN